MDMIAILLSSMLSLTGAEAIESGEAALQAGYWEQAITFFKEALAADLSPPANATCYWNMFLAYDQMGNADIAAENLMMFSSTVNFYKEYLEQAPVGHPGYIWLAQAGIENKMIYAEALLNIFWMRKNTYSCRSETFSCSVPEAKMIGLYAFKLPFCKNVGIKSIDSSTPEPNLTVDVGCTNGSTEKYYFTVKNGQNIR